jgi:hypothetical protein
LTAADASNAAQRLLKPDGEDERPNLPIVLLRWTCAMCDRIGISGFSRALAKCTAMMPGCGREVRWMHSSHAAVEGRKPG